MSGPGRCIRLTTHAWRNQIFRLPPKEDYHVYILHVASITSHTHDRRKSIGEEETKKRKEDKGKERKEKKNETKRKRQAKKRKRQEKQGKTRQESKEKKKKKKKEKRKRKKKRKRNVILADPRNRLRMALG